MKPQVSSEMEKIPQTGEQETALTLRIPPEARIPDGASFYEGDDDGTCRVVRPNGARCRARRMRETGLCSGHAGLGIAANPGAYSEAGHAAKARRATMRATLGITARTAAQPLHIARMRAQQRAEDYARAVVDAPLDDDTIGTIARQQAALRALELLYPQATLSASVELPQDADEVSGMGWQDMQALAASLVTSGDQEA